MSNRKGKTNRTTFAQMVNEVPSRIPRPGRPEDLPVIFSFKHLDSAHFKFGASRVQDLSYLPAFLERLKEICRISLNEFVNPTAHGSNPKSLRSHLIKFNETSEKNGFALKDTAWRDRPWQFEITKSKYGRIHGFLVENVFYVVWLDPDHQLYPS